MTRHKCNCGKPATFMLTLRRKDGKAIQHGASCDHALCGVATNLLNSKTDKGDYVTIRKEE